MRTLFYLEDIISMSLKMKPTLLQLKVQNAEKRQLLKDVFLIEQEKNDLFVNNIIAIKPQRYQQIYINKNTKQVRQVQSLRERPFLEDVLDIESAKQLAKFIFM